MRGDQFGDRPSRPPRRFLARSFGAGDVSLVNWLGHWSGLLRPELIQRRANRGRGNLSHAHRRAGGRRPCGMKATRGVPPRRTGLSFSRRRALFEAGAGAARED